MKIIVSHPTGNSNVRAVAKGFLESGSLFRFYTTIASFPNGFLYKLGSFPPLKEIRRRSYDGKLEPLTNTYPWREIGRTISSKFKLNNFLVHEKGIFCIDQIYKSLDKHVATDLSIAQKKGVTAVYAYEDGALETFTEAKKLGLLCIYDLPIAYWETGRKLLMEEAERLPQWAKTLGGGITDSAVKLERKRKELELADVVVGPGSFVLDSLPEWSADKIKIVSPFGSPASNISLNVVEKNPDKPLRVLFVGSMGQRKGLGDLFEAVKSLQGINVELVVLGSLLAPMEFYRSQFSDFTYEPGRSHNEVLELMRTCDVFCLPSIVEGRALVIQEAMSQGLPIIITPNTGGEDLVIEGETGFLVPIRSAEAIAEKIKWFAENRDKIAMMGKKAAVHAQNYTWENYSNNIVKQLDLYYNSIKSN
ncbi:glycosyltransferase family 4 protein [Flavobacterium sp.]|uniref:glycosyltransferase family 4 protein n=1 Tax=Flavobacterium sp. TaxID=239 RepID=UPI002C240D31|nr:glycosyltransferase family 4 protein [Flavobacterium sp.]HSD06039.1 glycosyltransferase family 4 protein [Flavobacterium sp.]